MKGQSLVVQFMLFFVIGLALFIAIGGVFRIQSDIFKEDVAKVNRQLVGSYISSLAISMADSCKECDYIDYTIRLKNVTANYIMSLIFTKAGLQVYSEPGGGNASIGVHNLNWTYGLEGNAASTLPIILRLNKTSSSLNIGIGK